MPPTPRRCTTCDREPSGLIPRAHDFCEFCGERLPELEPERVMGSCYRCGKKFETVPGVTMCEACLQVPVVITAAPPEKSLGKAALWGASFPLLVRIAYGTLIGSSPSREAQALVGLIAFFASGLLLAGVGWATDQSSKYQSAIEQAVAWLAFGVTAASLWALT